MTKPIATAARVGPTEANLTCRCKHSRAHVQTKLSFPLLPLLYLVMSAAPVIPPSLVMLLLSCQLLRTILGHALGLTPLSIDPMWRVSKAPKNSQEKSTFRGT